MGLVGVYQNPVDHNPCQQVLHTMAYVCRGGPKDKQTNKQTSMCDGTMKPMKLTSVV